jgi:hypothetical protein
MMMDIDEKIAFKSQIVGHFFIDVHHHIFRVNNGLRKDKLNRK